jgi:outer membrane protein
MKKIIFLLYFLTSLLAESYCQIKRIGLQDYVTIALEQSPSTLQARTLKENKYWQWRTFKSNYRPQLSLDGYVPEYNRAITPVIQPDGSIQFQPVTINSSLVNLSLSQTVAPTGGQIFVQSQLQRFDDFNRGERRYNGNPAVIGVNQPLFAFNSLIWDKRIEPLKYEESLKTFVEDMERVSYRAAELFFNTLAAQMNLEVALNNLENTDTIFKISEVKYTLGKISKGELLQLRLGILNSKKDVAQAKLSYETSTIVLLSFAGLKFNDDFKLNLPSAIPDFDVSHELALLQAKKNRSDAVGFRRRLMEAQRAVAKARGDNGLNANLIATFGLTNRSTNIQDIYTNVNDQQTVRLGFSIPIMDWGRSVSRIKTAKANERLVEYVIEQEEVTFDQEIITQVKQFEMLKEQVTITKEAAEISEERYLISKNRYLMGELDITNLNIAQQEKDQTKRDYISSLRNFWLAFYNLRLLTLYDFELARNIEID